MQAPWRARSSFRLTRAPKGLLPRGGAAAFLIHGRRLSSLHVAQLDEGVAQGIQTFLLEKTVHRLFGPFEPQTKAHSDQAEEETGPEAQSEWPVSGRGSVPYSP